MTMNNNDDDDSKQMYTSDHIMQVGTTDISVTITKTRTKMIFCN